MNKAHAIDAGFDLVATHGGIITREGVTAFSTGDFGDIPQGHVGLVCSRSGLAANHGVFVLNSPGIVDPGYTGELKVLLTKVGGKPFTVLKGDRIAQLVVVPLSAYIPKVEMLRGDNGFGSTGVSDTLGSAIDNSVDNLRVALG